MILSVFGTHSVTQLVQHKCCDICEMNCSSDDGGKFPGFKHSVPVDNSVAEVFNTRPVRSVPAQKVHLVTTALHEHQHRQEDIYKRSQQLMYTTSVLMTPISDEVIQEIVVNIAKLITVEDILEQLPVLTEDQAKDIIDIIDYIMSF